MKKYKSASIILIFAIIVSSGSVLFSKAREFSIIDPNKVTRINEDRIVFQRIEKMKNADTDDYIENYTVTIDNSVENLLIIKNKKSHFISDGFDFVSDIKSNKIISDSLNKYVDENDFWLNKINGKPDYIKILDRRSDQMVNTNEEFVTTNFGAFYKSVRDRFIKLHVDKFRQLIRNRGESKFTVTKKVISYKVNPENLNDVQNKYHIIAKAKSTDGTVYLCEDADGDGVTETFTADRNDGFDWGIGSGPNLLNITGNTDKDIETLIGKLANESIHGTVEEEKKMFQQFPTEKEIIDLMDQVTPPDKFYE